MTQAPSVQTALAPIPVDVETKGNDAFWASRGQDGTTLLSGLQVIMYQEQSGAKEPVVLWINEDRPNKLDLMLPKGFESPSDVTDTTQYPDGLEGLLRMKRTVSVERVVETDNGREIREIKFDVLNIKVKGGERFREPLKELKRKYNYIVSDGTGGPDWIIARLKECNPRIANIIPNTDIHITCIDDIIYEGSDGTKKLDISNILVQPDDQNIIQAFREAELSRYIRWAVDQTIESCGEKGSTLDTQLTQALLENNIGAQNDIRSQKLQLMMEYLIAIELDAWTKSAFEKSLEEVSEEYKKAKSRLPFDYYLAELPIPTEEIGTDGTKRKRPTAEIDLDKKRRTYHKEYISYLVKTFEAVAEELDELYLEKYDKSCGLHQVKGEGQKVITPMSMGDSRYLVNISEATAKALYNLGFSHECIQKTGLAPHLEKSLIDIQLENIFLAIRSNEEDTAEYGFDKFTIAYALVANRPELEDRIIGAMQRTKLYSDASTTTDTIERSQISNKEHNYMQNKRAIDSFLFSGMENHRRRIKAEFTSNSFNADYTSGLINRGTLARIRPIFECAREIYKMKLGLIANQLQDRELEEGTTLSMKHQSELLYKGVNEYSKHAAGIELIKFGFVPYVRTVKKLAETHQLTRLVNSRFYNFLERLWLSHPEIHQEMFDINKVNQRLPQEQQKSFPVKFLRRMYTSIFGSAKDFETDAMEEAKQQYAS